MEYDIIVIGAGILGTASAYHLKRTCPEKRILLIDKEGDVAQGDTAKAAGMFRNVWSSATNRALANSSIDFYMALQERHDIDLKLTCYLWLLDREQLGRAMTSLKSLLGKDVQPVSRKKLKRIPRLKLEVETDREAQLMSLKNIRGGLIGLKCGSLDPYRLAKYYQEQFEELGGEVRLNTPVDRLLITPSRRLGIPQEPLVWQKLRVGAVQTGEGEIRAGRIVLAAGGLTNLLLDPLGVDSHMRPKKRQLFQLRGPELAELLNLSGFNEEGTIPFTILPKSGIYIRPIKPEGCFWVGCADGLGRPFGLDTEPEEEFYQYHIYPVLSKYFPQFVTARVKNAWAGLYAYNTIDRIPYVFESHGILVVTGCSGSGIMKADALGRIVAGLYRGEEWVSLYGGIKFRVADIGIEGRRVEREKFVI